MEIGRIIDISRPVGTNSACFPGDVPFSKEVTVSYRDSGVINLTAIRMSPHVGTHADAPVHIHGDIAAGEETAAALPLHPFLGPALVVDVAPSRVAVTAEKAKETLDGIADLPPRVLFRTASEIRYDVFEDEYAYFSVDLIDYLASRGVVLAGIDTPSVDHVRSKTLDAHHALHRHRMSWLENLDLTRVEAGRYVLVALPLKLLEVEASPVRAVLLTDK